MCVCVCVCVSCLRVCLSTESAKNVSWLSPLQGWGILTMTFLGKIGYKSNTYKECTRNKDIANIFIVWQWVYSKSIS